MKYSGSVLKGLTIVFLSTILLLSTVEIDAQYRHNKEIYDAADYTTDMYGPYYPVAAGIASFLIPGSGQMLSGEFGRGLIFLGAELGSLVLFPIGFAFAWGGYDILGPSMMLTSIAGVLTTHIWAAIDASRVAKVNNLAAVDQRNLDSSWRISPDLKILPNLKAAPSLTFSYTF